VRFNYKVIPLREPHPAFPSVTSTWLPVLPVRLSYGHGKQTPRIEALVDSGAANCLFRADICPFIGITLKDGVHGITRGIIPHQKIDVYYHDIKLWVGADMIQIKAGFADRLSVGALLGRRGFFENFIVTFDPSANPPGFEIQRLGRA
jgi:hypothetical protein